MSTRTIAPTPELEADVESRVATGHCGNAGEVVRAGKRLMMERDQSACRPCVMDIEERPTQ